MNNNTVYNVIKAMQLFVTIALVCVLIIISNNLENGRYQMGDNNDGKFIKVFDTKTGELYFMDSHANYIKLTDGERIILKKLPK